MILEKGTCDYALSELEPETDVLVILHREGYPTEYLETLTKIISSRISLRVLYYRESAASCNSFTSESCTVPVKGNKTNRMSHYTAKFDEDSMQIRNISKLFFMVAQQGVLQLVPPLKLWGELQQVMF